MTTPRRRPLCDVYRASGYAHVLGSEAWTLSTPDGRRLRFCSLFPCLVAYVCNLPYEDLEPRAIGLAHSTAATGTAG